MAEQRNPDNSRNVQEFTPDFGNTFDDYGEYREPVAEAPARVTRRKRHLKKLRFPRLVWVALFLGLAVLLGILAAKWGWKWADDVLALTRPDQFVEIVINENDDLDRITQTLQDAGAVQYGWLFKLYCKFSGSENYFDPGIYKINLTYDYHALVNNLMASAGSRETVTLMIREGLSCYEIFDLFEENNVCSREKLEEAAATYEYDYEFLKDLPYGESNRLEGYLFPDTYEFYTDSSEVAIVDKMLAAFEAHFEKAYYDRLDEIGMNLDQVITIASMAQMEGRTENDFYSIAGVFNNRLKSSEFPYLQSDATVQYAIQDHKEDLSSEDLSVASPYNTYVVRGLPPGPISNPGWAAIQAALYPESNDYYFFIADVDGTTLFARNITEHQRNAAQVNANRAKAAAAASN